MYCSEWCKWKNYLSLLLSSSSPKRLSCVPLGVLKNKLLFFLGSSDSSCYLTFHSLLIPLSGIFFFNVDCFKNILFLFPTLLINRGDTSGINP